MGTGITTNKINIAITVTVETIIVPYLVRVGITPTSDKRVVGSEEPKTNMVNDVLSMGITVSVQRDQKSQR